MFVPPPPWSVLLSGSFKVVSTTEMSCFRLSGCSIQLLLDLQSYPPCS